MQKYEVIYLKEIASDQLNLEIGSYLMSRQRVGQPLREFITIKLETTSAQVIVIDFSQIEDVTVSVADELGPKLFRNFVNLWSDKTKQTPYLVYANLSPDLLNSMERVFRQDDKELVACLFKQFSDSRFYNHFFVGDGLPDALREVLNRIYSLRKANSVQLEDHDIAAASRKLNALMNKYPWLLKREKEMLDDRAWTYIYQPIVPTYQEIL